MKHLIKKITLLLLVLSAALQVQAQESVEMADRLRADGKIYVVVGIILIILAGFIGYLITIDFKIKKLEKLISEKGPGK
jgi:hypothetical protein